LMSENGRFGACSAFWGLENSVGYFVG